MNIRKRIVRILVFLSLIAAGFIMGVHAGFAEAPEPEVVLEGKELYLFLVDKYAAEYGVSSEKMIRTIDCENRDWNPSLQSGIYYKGKREESYGLSQINLPHNPSVTLEQATDPEFSIEFMAKKLSEGRGGLWTCYRNIYY